MELEGAGGSQRHRVVSYRALIGLAGAGLVVAGVAIAVGSPAGLRSVLGIPGTLLLPGLLLSFLIFPPRTIDGTLRWVVSVALSLTLAMAVGLSVVEILGRVSAQGVGESDIGIALLLVWPALARAHQQSASIPIPGHINRGVPVVGVCVIGALLAAIVLMRAPAPGSKFVTLALDAREGSTPVVQVANHGTGHNAYLLVAFTQQKPDVLSRVINPSPGVVLDVGLGPVEQLKSGTRVFVQLRPLSGRVFRSLSFYVRAGQNAGTAGV
jgi:hypothetical protein